MNGGQVGHVKLVVTCNYLVLIGPDGAHLLTHLNRGGCLENSELLGRAWSGISVHDTTQRLCNVFGLFQVHRELLCA